VPPTTPEDQQDADFTEIVGRHDHTGVGRQQIIFVDPFDQPRRFDLKLHCALARQVPHRPHRPGGAEVQGFVAGCGIDIRIQRMDRPAVFAVQLGLEVRDDGMNRRLSHGRVPGPDGQCFVPTRFEQHDEHPR
jgi:hypothetical protein